MMKSKGYKQLLKLLWPLALVYASFVEIYKLLFKWGYLQSKRFEVATIVVGNLSTGGTGKTPHVEYIVQHLGHYHNLAVLSRGYGRKSKGFLQINWEDSAELSGDEPLQMAKKFPDIPFYVSENRCKGLEQIIRINPHTQLVILDDAMQHFQLRADFYILLTTYQQPFFSDLPLPAGNLREFAFNSERAQIIVVTKCPETIDQEDAKQWIRKIQPRKGQRVFFSTMIYGNPYNQAGDYIDKEQLGNKQVLLVSGIAEDKVLNDYLKSKVAFLEHLSWKDHQHYDKNKIDLIENSWNKFKENNSHPILLTTEKDAVKWQNSNLEYFILPIHVDICFNEASSFQRALIEVMYQKKGYPSSIL